MTLIDKEKTIGNIESAVKDNPDIKVRDVIDMIRTQPEEEYKECEHITEILSAAISELYEGAEDWYREELPDILGTTEEELASFGIRI